MSSEPSYIPQIISGLSGLIGALIGGVVTWIVQTQRLRHERDIDKATRQAQRRADESRRRSEFLLSVSKRDTKLLIRTKVTVRKLLQRAKLALDKDSETELLPLVRIIESNSGYLTRYPEVLQPLDMFARESRQVLAAATTDNMAVLGGIVFQNFVLHGTWAIKECDRFIYKQPGESPLRLLRLSTSFLSTKLAQDTVYQQNDEELRSMIEYHLSCLDNQEVVDLAFDDDQLSQAIQKFRHHASILHRSYMPEAAAEPLDGKEIDNHITQMKRYASFIRKRLDFSQ